MGHPDAPLDDVLGLVPGTPSDGPPDRSKTRFKNNLPWSRLGRWTVHPGGVVLLLLLTVVFLVVRLSIPGVLEHGQGVLDAARSRFGAIALLLATVSIALARRSAGRSERRAVLLFLSCALLLGFDALVLRGLEARDQLRWWDQLTAEPDPLPVAAFSDGDEVEILLPDVVRGREVWNQTCLPCHGADAKGVEGQGKDITDSEFIAQRSDLELVDFLRVGRGVDDPANTTGLQMPPRGGNPLLGDVDLTSAVLHLRVLIGGGGDEAGSELVVPKWVLPLAMVAPPGLRSDRVRVVTDPSGPPPGASRFVPLHLGFVGLHGLYLALAMAVLALQVARALSMGDPRGLRQPLELPMHQFAVATVIWVVIQWYFYSTPGSSS